MRLQVSPEQPCCTEAADFARYKQHTRKDTQHSLQANIMTRRITPIVALACAAAAFTPPNTPQRAPSSLSAGFGKTTASTTKAVQIKGAPKPMEKQWDNYFTLKDDGGEIREVFRGVTLQCHLLYHASMACTQLTGHFTQVWITTPDGDKPLPLGFVAARKDASPKEAVALQKKLILWCAEGLHPRLSPFLKKGKEVKLELNLCPVREMTEAEAGDLLVGEPGGPLDALGPVRAPPSLTAADVGFMPFKSPIEGAGKLSKQERSNLRSDTAALPFA